MVGEPGADDGDCGFEFEDWDGDEEAGDAALPLSHHRVNSAPRCSGHAGGHGRPDDLPGGERGLEGTHRRVAKPFTRWTHDTEQAFLLALRMTGQVRRAAAEIGRSWQAAYARRDRDPVFAAAWDQAVAAQQAEWIAAQRERLAPEDDGAGGGRLVPARERADGWNTARRTAFLTTLARTKEVKAACAAAGMSDTAAYQLRGRSPAFARAWEKALMGAPPPSVLDAAYARAVEGWEEPIVLGGKVAGTRWRYSEGLLRDLLKAEQGRGKAGGAVAEAVPEDGAAAPAEDAGAVVARLRGSPDPLRYWKNAAQRYAYDVAQAAGGVFTLKALREETDAAIFDKIEKIDLVRRREAAARDETEWARWRGMWCTMGCSRAETV